MIDQAEGLMTIAAGLLAYALIVQAMMAAVLLLAQFTVLQWRALRTLIQEPPRRPLPEVQQDQGQGEPPFRVGGGLVRWE